MSQVVPISSYQDCEAYMARQAHPRAMENYPKFQYSVFVGENRDEQVVIRAESIEEFTQLKAAIVPFLTSQQSAPKAGNGNGTAKAGKFQCEACGGKAEYREVVG